MNDDDKNVSSPERLDETRIERGERDPEPKEKKFSLFGDLFGKKKETDEEKLRKKLDEELKEAARKRATDFEEERRAEEKREVAETRKLKKRWRAKLVEKSQKVLEDTANRGEEPANGLEIAKIMVAERIVRLHTMLHDEDLDLRRSEEKALKIQIDFMGLLSEKLDAPKLEVPIEVEQVYQTIVDSVKDTAANSEQPIIATRAEEQNTAEMSPDDTSYMQYAVVIVDMVKRVIVQQKSPSQLTGGGPTPVYDTTTQSSKPTERIPYSTTIPQHSETAATSDKKAQLTAADRLLAVIKSVAEPTQNIRQEIQHAKTIRRLADIVEKTGLTVKPPLSHVSAITESIVPTLAVAGLAKQEAATEKPLQSLKMPTEVPETTYTARQSSLTVPPRVENIRPKSESIRSETLPEAPPLSRERSTPPAVADAVEWREEKPVIITHQHTRREQIAQPPAKEDSNVTTHTPEQEPMTTAAPEQVKAPRIKIQNMTEIQLVALARTVDIGFGRKLSDAYVRGEITREGLVNVLKKYKKGADYRAEFRRQREAYQHRKRPSVEALPTLPEEHPDAINASTVQQQESAQTKVKARAAGKTIISATRQTTVEARRIARETRALFDRQKHMVLLFTSTALVIVLLFLLIELTIR